MCPWKWIESKVRESVFRTKKLPRLYSQSLIFQLNYLSFHSVTQQLEKNVYFFLIKIEFLITVKA